MTNKIKYYADNNDNITIIYLHTIMPNMHTIIIINTPKVGGYHGIVLDKKNIKNSPWLPPAILQPLFIYFRQMSATFHCCYLLF